MGATICHKKGLDKIEYEVYNIPIRYAGGFISNIQINLQVPPRDIVGRY